MNDPTVPASRTDLGSSVERDESASESAIDSAAQDAPTRTMARTAAALMIGAELLSGKIRDENLPRLCTTLRALGIRLCRATVLPDDREIIAGDIRQLARTHDVVFTSGGVGPTHDDVTVQGVADGLGCEVIEDPRMLELLARVYGDQLTDAHRLMARVPAGSRLLETRHVRWPTIVAQNVWILPGVPQLFHMKLSVVREHLTGPEPFFSDFVLTRRDEPSLKDALDRVVAKYPNVEIGSYPKWFDERYKTRVTFDARTREEARGARAEFVASLDSTDVVEGE